MHQCRTALCMEATCLVAYILAFTHTHQHTETEVALLSSLLSRNFALSLFVSQLAPWCASVLSILSYWFPSVFPKHCRLVGWVASGIQMCRMRYVYEGFWTCLQSCRFLTWHSTRGSLSGTLSVLKVCESGTVGFIPFVVLEPETQGLKERDRDSPSMFNSL